MFDLECFINDCMLLKPALTLARDGKKAAYERLEFLGDRVLGLVVAEMLYTHYSDEAEGALAHRFTELVREETLAQIALEMNLPAYLITNEPELRKNHSVLSDVCEAVLGAIYLEKGYECAKTVIQPLWMPHMLSYVQAPKDFKSTLQEWTQKKKLGLPEYQLTDKKGTEHEPSFEICVTVGHYSAIGTGTSKKEAQQKAAGALLDILKKKGLF